MLHLASPTPIKQPRNEEDVIRPAVEGTRSVLRACADAKCVKRIVITSSIAAIAGSCLDKNLLLCRYIFGAGLG